MRMAAVLGMRFPGEFLSSFRTVNLLDRYGGREGDADCFDVRAARVRAAFLLLRMRYSTAFLAGRAVASVFGLDGVAPLSAIDRGGVRFVTIPHPSAANRWYNSPENVGRLKDVMLREIKRATARSRFLAASSR
jgi:hypothetical protein